MKKIIIGNWKLNLDHLEAIQLLQKINYSLLSKRLTKNFYKKRSQILIKSNTKEIRGLFKEINSNGELVIESDDKTIHKFVYGEILS